MDAGITYAKQYKLRPGIAMTAAQMAVLTSDIVWLVEQEVTLADGSKTKALVPQVYSDKGQASSTTKSGISGIAANTAVRSTDAQTGIARIFDAHQTQKGYQRADADHAGLQRGKQRKFCQ